MEILELFTVLKNGESDTIEFKENFSEAIRRSACAFANTEGGRIFIGIKDDGTPVGFSESRYQQKISNLLQSLKPAPSFNIEEIFITSAKVVVISIKKSQFLTSLRNIVYVRAGTNNYPLSIEEVVEKSAESLRIFFDQIRAKAPLSALNKKLFKNYLKKKEKIRRAKIYGDLIENALKAKVFQKKGKSIYFTNAGLLCFTKEPQQYINNASVRLVWFDDDEMKTYREQREFLGPLPKIISEIEVFFRRELRRIGGFTVGFKRKEFLEYPFEALREAIINAVVHRNYFDPADIRIFIFPRRIEIKNPGSFPPGVSVENPEHKPRNPIIAQFFYDLGLTEKYGSGIRKIIREAGQHPLVDVKFVIRPYVTTVIFEKATEEISLDKLNRDILEFLVDGQKRSSEICKVTGLSRQATIVRLKDLMVLGFVQLVGRGPQTFYKLSKTLKEN